MSTISINEFTIASCEIPNPPQLCTSTAVGGATKQEVGEGGGGDDLMLIQSHTQLTPSLRGH